MEAFHGARLTSAPAPPTGGDDAGRAAARGLAPLAIISLALPPIGAALLLGYLSRIGPWLQGLGGRGIALYVAGFALLGGFALLPTYAPAILGGWAFGDRTGIPAALAEWVKGQHLTPGMLALYLSIMYIILGCLIDGISMIVLTAVVVLPMVQQAGLDLIWFGVYLVIHVEMAQVTPPVGFNLFVLQNMSGRDTLTVAKAAFPFFMLLVAAVFIITEFPQIVLVLPHLAFPPS